MLSKKMQDALNEQINAELYSWYLYYAMSAWAASENFAGSARWLRAQAQEELAHAGKFFDYINEKGGRVELKPIEGPAKEWKSLQEAFEGALKHEQYITGRINDLVDLAIEEKDHATNAFLQWFVNEQVEEEASADEVVQKLKMISGAPGGTFMLDSKLGERGG